MTDAAIFIPTPSPALAFFNASGKLILDPTVEAELRAIIRGMVSEELARQQAGLQRA